MDHHVHAAITEGLRQRGVDVLPAHEDGAAQLDDEELLARATQLGRVLFSQDEDLLTLTHRWLQTGRVFAGLVYAHQLGVTIGQAIRDLELMAYALDPEDMRNRITFIPF
jgi:predicted nuclease of predicted toxin-antitoxin system